MHVPRNYPGHLRFTRYTLITITAALVGFRLYRAAGESTADLITSLSTVAGLIGATAAGYAVRIRELRRRAEHAELKVVQLRAGLLEGDEDKALWDSVEPYETASDEDTYKFGLNVIAINQHRYRQAG